MKRNCQSNDGCDASEAKRHQVAGAIIQCMTSDQSGSSYIAKLQRWRDSMPFRAVRNELPLGWHCKPMLDVLQACPAILDLWIEKVERGGWLFECGSRHPYGHVLPQDFAGMSTEAVAEAHPCFEDMIACAIVEGRVVTYDRNDMAWIGLRSQGREKARRWLKGLPLTVSDPCTSRTSVPSVVWSSPDASTQGCAHDNHADPDSDLGSLNMIPNHFLSLSPSDVLALAPALCETFDILGIEGRAGRTHDGCWSMGQLMESRSELRDALADLLLTSKIAFADIRLHIVAQGIAIWLGNGSCSLVEAREKLLHKCWNRLGLWR